VLSFATRYEPRAWVIEGAGGLGALLAQLLVAAGESVLDPLIRQAQRAVRSTLYRFVDGYRDWGKWRNEHAVEHAPEWNVVTTMRDLRDMRHSPSCCLTRPSRSRRPFVR
jgi:hypothetical protein